MGLLDLFKRDSPGILASGHHPKLLIDPQGEPPCKGWLDIELDLSGTHLRFKVPPKSHPNIFSETDQRNYNLYNNELFKPANGREISDYAAEKITHHLPVFSSGWELYLPTRKAENIAQVRFLLNIYKPQKQASLFSTANLQQALINVVNITTGPDSSRGRYEQQYDEFHNWKTEIHSQHEWLSFYSIPLQGRIGNTYYRLIPLTDGHFLQVAFSSTSYKSTQDIAPPW